MSPAKGAAYYSRKVTELYTKLAKFTPSHSSDIAFGIKEEGSRDFLNEQVRRHVKKEYF